MNFNGIWADKPKGTKLVVLGVLIFSSSSIFLLLGSIIAGTLSDVADLSNLTNNLDDPNNINALKTLQGFQHLGLFVVPPLLFAYLCTSHSSDYLKLKNIPPLFSILIAIVAMLTCNPVINWMVEINELLKLPEFLSGLEAWMKEAEETAKIYTKAFLKMDNLSDLAINILIIALIPAIGEELLFRGILQTVFTNWTKSAHWGIVIAALLFSAMHMQFYGFLPRFAMGLLFGYLLIWSGSLWLPIICHFTNNGSAVLFTYLNDKGIVDFDSDTVGVNESTQLYTPLAVCALAYFLYLIYRKGKAEKIHI